MIRNNALRFIAILVLTIAGTWLSGWWAVPVIALIAGLVRTPAWIPAMAATLAWGLLLVVDIAGGQFGKLMTMLGSVMGLPPIAIIGLTLLFPALLGWSAAATGTALRSIGGGRDPDRPLSSAP